MSEWKLLGLLATPAVIFFFWYVSQANADLKDGDYFCQLREGIPISTRYSVTVRDNRIVSGERSMAGYSEPLTDFSMGSTEGSEKFAASLDGMGPFDCKFDE